MWKVGDRVLARRRPEVFWYPATVRHIDGPRYYVIFDDGDDGFAAAEDMIPCQFEAGDRVQVYQAAASNYLPARVVGTDTDTLTVRYMNKEEQPVAVAKIRVQPDVWKQAGLTSEEAARHEWSVCDRVLACGRDLDWYPGVVLDVQGDRVRILFDTGNQSVLPLVKLRPLELATGERILCRRKGGPDYYSGTIAVIDGEKIVVHYDDGSRETTTVRLLRLRRDEWLPVGPGLRARPGVRLLAQADDLLWYPGTLQAMDGKRLQVTYEDGDEALVTPDQVRPLDIHVGSRIFCRRGGRPEFVPAEVTAREAQRIRVAYTDGSEEWTSLRMMRVER